MSASVKSYAMYPIPPSGDPDGIGFGALDPRIGSGCWPAMSLLMRIFSFPSTLGMRMALQDWRSERRMSAAFFCATMENEHANRWWCCVSPNWPIFTAAAKSA